MASKAYTYTITLLLVVILTTHNEAQASDPGITSDFIAPQGLELSNVNSSFFTFTGFRPIINGGLQQPSSFKVSMATQVEFPGLQGQSVAYSILQYPANTLNPPHIHPRSSELLLLVQGWLEVGFVDSANNKLFSQNLESGDLFVFPQGLVHFQVNKSLKYPAMAIAAFGSADPGVISLPLALFESGIENEVLAKSFKTDVATVEKLISAIKG